MASSLRPVLAAAFEDCRRIDSKNAQWGNVVADFRRVGVDLKAGLAQYKRTDSRREKLGLLLEARNAIAHSDADKLASVQAVVPVTLKTSRIWREALNGLTVDMDRVTKAQLSQLTGQEPW
ncbi:hypothetical protein GOARA_061_01060 [Gordonia araii NBRC 100433]|uniref:RiboL-PSP-HEPN domain-containing protein n=1 Tax=Gordonia araii NBRC 100433 TaxID=1073574 RepID=G7H492_9ACTN|nr:hypothetical protein GOARA_061_01060 [Gordonia araii NBRC 100433]